MGITIKGLSSLQAKLKRLDPITRSAVEHGVVLAGLMVEGAAKMLAPVSDEITRPGGPHGDLRRSINTVTKVTSGGAQATVGSSIEYAAYVELGTTRQQAQPYLHPALQKNKANIKKIIITEIVKAHKGL